MKRILQIFATITCIVICTCAHAQVLTVKFTGRDQTGQHYVKLDHVKTFNLDQLWEEVLYFPDTTLVLGGVGIIDYGNSATSQLEQNVPNPFDGTTNFTLYLREGADVLLEIFDLMGKSVVNQHYTDLSAGAHLFSANLTNPQVYILKVSVKNEQMHLKMVNKGYGTENSISHVSTSSPNGEFESGAKDSQAMGIYPFQQGDELQHTGYTVINGVEYKSETITQQQNESETMILPFNLTPAVITNTVSGITGTSAVCGGMVNYTGEATVVSRGICWSTSPNPTIDDNSTFDGNGIGSFTSNIIGLTPGTTYYVKAYATSSASITGYGEQVIFNTLATIPSVTTSMVSNITDNSATCGGNVTSDGGTTVTSRGVCWSTSQNPTIADNHSNDGSGTGIFTSIITGLVPNTTYYVRAYATNSEGTSYGEQRIFSTEITPPLVSTLNANNISATRATCGGNVTSDGGSTITARGVCWSTSPNPTLSDSYTSDGSGTGIFISSVSNLIASTTYYMRAYAINNAGIAYGNQVSFTTTASISCGSSMVYDYDGNSYNTIQIGYQCWMKENLKTTHYANGTLITSSSSTSTTTGYYYDGGDNPSIYGYYYNWRAVMGCPSSDYGDSNNAYSICPSGWHVPNDTDWAQLTNYVCGQSQYVCGAINSSIAKALASISGWESDTTTCSVGNNLNANNATGFTAFPSGYRFGYYFGDGNTSSKFWSTTEIDDYNAQSFTLRHNRAYISMGSSGKSLGYSVRCIYNESCIHTTPSVSTNTVSNISATSAACGGNVTSDGGSAVTSRGVCWSTSQNPTINDAHTTNGTGTGVFSCSITGLAPETTYYIRAYAINNVGTSYGNQYIFTTIIPDGQPCNPSTVTDVDGNVYNTVKLGNQCWMKENLRTKHYASGNSIGNGGDGTSYSNGYYYYSNGFYNSDYGYLYNWAAVMSNAAGSEATPRYLCPYGWHVPSIAEWTQLKNYLCNQNDYTCGNDSMKIAKSLASTSGWYNSSTTCNVGNSPSTNNATNFSIFPAGEIDGSLSFKANFWSTTQDGYDNNSTAMIFYLRYNSSVVGIGREYKNAGCSIRCLRD